MSSIVTRTAAVLARLDRLDAEGWAELYHRMVDLQGISTEAPALTRPVRVDLESLEAALAQTPVCTCTEASQSPSPSQPANQDE